MVRRKSIGWKKSLVLALFVVASAICGTVLFSSQAHADGVGAETVFSWIPNNYISVTHFPNANIYSHNTTEFYFNCVPDVAAKYNCTSDKKVGRSSYGDGKKDGTGRCGPDMVINGNSAQAILSFYTDPGLPKDCIKASTATVNITNTAAAPADLVDGGADNCAGNAADGGTDTCAPATSDSTPDPELQCGKKRYSLNWFLCPLYKMVNGIVGALDDFINTFLYVDQNKIFNQSTASGKGYYSAWSTLRIIALALIVIAGLVMVIAQALGFEILDAYTVKKIMPRLVVAIIAIALSWYIMEFFVVLTNNLGLGIRQIIFYPFKDMPGAIQFSGGSAIATAILAGSAFLALGPFGLLSFAGTAFLAIVVAFLVLMVRQLVVIVLILAAPIAIACSILPNTQGAYKLWYESFTKAMMMFPIIVAFIAIGRVFALVSIGTDISAAPAISQLIGFAAYFLPYFLIPLTFSLAGGAMRFVGGQVNDRSRGGFDRLKKFRGNTMAQRGLAAKQGNLMRGNNIASRGFNKLTSTGAAVPTAGIGFNPAKWRQRTQSAMSNASMLEAAEYSEKNHAFQAIKGNDDYLNAGRLFNGNESKMKKYLTDKGYSDAGADQGVAAIRAARRDAPNEVFDTAAVMALPGTGTAFKGGVGEMNEAVMEVAGNDDVKAARMIASMRGAAGQARRPDLGGGSFSAQLKDYQAQRDGTITADQATRRTYEATLEGQGGNYIVNARKSTVEALAPVMMDKLNTAVSTGDDGLINRQLAILAGRYDAMAQVSPENASAMADNVMSLTITHPITNRTVTVQQAIEDRRGDASFKEMRREYQNAGLQAAQNAANQPINAPGGPGTAGPTPPTPF